MGFKTLFLPASPFGPAVPPIPTILLLSPHAENDDDEAMEEIFEDNLAPPPPLPPSRRGRGAERVKAPLTTVPSSSAASPSSSGPVALRPFTGAAVLPPARHGRGRAGVDGRGGAGSTKSEGGAAGAGGSKFPGGFATGGGWGGKGQQSLQAVKLPPVKAPWARAGPDDGGEKAIKDALALLNQGGLAALPDISAVVAAPTATAPKAGVRPVRPAPEAAGVSAATETVEEQVEEEGAVVGGGLGAGKSTDGLEEEREEEEEEEDEDDEDEDEAMYGGEDDDDDPYGEEA